MLRLPGMGHISDEKRGFILFNPLMCFEMRLLMPVEPDFGACKTPKRPEYLQIWRIEGRLRKSRGKIYG